jgi:hypothetical protein
MMAFISIIIIIDYAVSKELPNLHSVVVLLNAEDKKRYWARTLTRRAR